MTLRVVLYIEDNQDNRTLVRRVLEAEGYQVIEADSGNAGLKAVEKMTPPPDLVLMDINLPEIDGYQLTHLLKKMPRMAGVPVIAMTANVMKGDREKTLAAGCDGYIQKPIDVDQLPLQVEHFIKQASK